jgi:hypothetical protein
MEGRLSGGQRIQPMKRVFALKNPGLNRSEITGWAYPVAKNQ